MPDEKDRDEPVSLAPLDPETALRGLLAVKPDRDTAGEQGEQPPSDDLRGQESS